MQFVRLRCYLQSFGTELGLVAPLGIYRLFCKLLNMTLYNTTCTALFDSAHGWRNRGGGTGRDLPLPAPSISFPGWDPGGQYITKMGPFYFSWTVFNNCNSCIGSFGPFETLRDPFPRWSLRPSPPLLESFLQPVRHTVLYSYFV